MKSVRHSDLVMMRLTVRPAAHRQTGWGGVLRTKMCRDELMRL